MTHRIALACLLALADSPVAFSARAEMLHMMASNPAARSVLPAHVMQGQAQEFFVASMAPRITRRRV